jgi:hypothetical protein
LPFGLASADFNGDGFADLAVAGEHGGIAVLLNAGAAARVESITVNDGSSQRSKVTSLTVTFDSVVTLDPGAFELRGPGGDLVALNVQASVVGGKTVAVLSFTGDGIIGGSLPDGTYTLTVRADRVHDRLGRGLDADHVTTFFRLFGDSDGDADVDWRDLVRLLGTLGKRTGQAGFLGYFDYESNGVVGLRDALEFLRRFGRGGG